MTFVSTGIHVYLKAHFQCPTPSYLGPSRHEQSPLSMLLTKLHLSHVIKGEILTGPSAYEDFLNTLLRESMVRHSFQRLLVRGNLEDGPLFSMSMSMDIFMMMMVMVIMAIMVT